LVVFDENDSNGVRQRLVDTVACGVFGFGVGGLASLGREERCQTPFAVKCPIRPRVGRL
jgi:hypothetical protein